MTFFLLMVLNPGAQKRAHAQISAVVGEDRLPTSDDRPLLPFVDAIFRETLRHSPIAPLCELLRPLIALVADPTESRSDSHYYHGRRSVWWIPHSKG